MCFGSRVVFGYWATWSHYRDGEGQFTVEDIDPSLLTHLAYAFFGFDDDGFIEHLDENLDIELENIIETVKLKEKNSKLKVLASVGGWKLAPKKFSNMASDSTQRKNFVSSAIKFLKKHNFDGLDIDWEYPNGDNDKENFLILLNELRNKLKEEKLLLTVAVGASHEDASKSYDISELSKVVDLINLMTYDYHTEEKLSHNASLKNYNGNSVTKTVCHWLDKGANPSKLVLGIPFYGRSFITNNDTTFVSSKANGKGKPGPYTKEAGFIGYNEICKVLKSNNPQRCFDEHHSVPYAYYDDQWISYDDEKSIELKLNLIHERKLAGAMIWSIDMDDFHGTNGKKYCLLTTISENLNSWSSWLSCNIL